MFDYHLLRGFGTNLGESYINGKLKTRRNIMRWSFFEKLRTVAMVMEKPSKPKGIGPIVMIFARSSRFIHPKGLAKNEQNLPHSFGDKAPLTTERHHPSR